jgi:hypothetical protein
MTSASSITGATWVAIDVAKVTHQVLVEGPGGRRWAMRIANTASDIERLVTFLHALPQPCVIAFEPTGDYHRAVMHPPRTGRLHALSGIVAGRRADA